MLPIQFKLFLMFFVCKQIKIKIENKISKHRTVLDSKVWNYILANSEHLWLQYGGFSAENEFWNRRKWCPMGMQFHQSEKRGSFMVDFW